MSSISRVVVQRPADERVNWRTSIPFIIIHLLPFVAIWTGVSVRAAVLFVVLYWGRLFFVTGGFHRYFAHKSYKTNRVVQFLIAFGATSANQKGPLWWAGWHRHHHRFSDTDEDLHSPRKGFWWSHVGWILCDRFKETPTRYIKDFDAYPELRWLDKYWIVPPIIVAGASLAIAGLPGLFFGYFASTILLMHTTYLVNSVTHLFGKRRYATVDTSRNSFLIALLTWGEGWHNNHHYYQASVRQGFFWWEIDLTYYILVVMSWFGLVKDFRVPPERVRAGERIKEGHFDVGMFAAHWGKAIGALSAGRDRAGEYAGAKRRAIEEFVESSKETADEFARIAKQQAGSKPTTAAGDI